jgi:hypothetical protein
MAFDVQEPELSTLTFNGRFPWSDHPRLLSLRSVQ